MSKHSFGCDYMTTINGKMAVEVESPSNKRDLIAMKDSNLFGSFLKSCASVKVRCAANQANLLNANLLPVNAEAKETRQFLNDLSVDSDAGKYRNSKRKLPVQQSRTAV